MSGFTQLTVGGGYNGHLGVVSVPSSTIWGSASTGTTINHSLQTYLGGVYQSILGGAGFINSDIAGSSTVTAGGGASVFQEFTNVNGTTSVVSGSVSGSASVAGGTTDLLVEAPGNLTLTGSSNSTMALFGMNSNVNYSVTDPKAGSIYLAGGANSITLNSLHSTNAETIYSAGTDTINLVGQGSDYVSVYGNAVIQDFSANATVAAEGSATTNLYWDNANAGGTLHFINNSSVAATIHIGNFNGLTSTTRVTASGGAGGGFFVGGSSGSNSLIGGSGVVTLVGAGSGDILEANSNKGTNLLFGGPGTETLAASSLSGANLFQVGLNYPGLSGAPAANGVVSTAGSGAQTFFFGNVPGGETVYGSTKATSNVFFIESGTVPAAQGGGTIGGGLYNIYNFVNADIFLTGFGATGKGAAIALQFVDPASTVAGGAAVLDVSLTDGTTIKIHGLSSSAITSALAGGDTFAGANGIIGIN